MARRSYDNTMGEGRHALLYLVDKSQRHTFKRPGTETVQQSSWALNFLL